jgi:hypothetical protein
MIIVIILFLLKLISTQKSQSIAAQITAIIFKTRLLTLGSSEVDIQTNFSRQKPSHLTQVH